MADLVPLCKLDVDEIRLTCGLCGTEGTVRRETGDVMDRVHAFAASHLDPHVVAARFVGPLGVVLGWLEL